MSIVSAIKSNPSLKNFVHYLFIPRGQARPSVWVKWFLNPFFHKVSRKSTIEDYCTVNNGVGNVHICSHSRIGMSNVIIGLVRIGNHVILAQNIVMSGLNHGYEDVTIPIYNRVTCTYGNTS